MRSLAYELGLAHFSLTPEEYVHKKAATNEIIGMLKKKQGKLLATMGLPADYISRIPYECQKCEDTGLIGLEFCECMNKIMQYEYASSNMTAEVIQTIRFYDSNPLQQKQMGAVYALLFKRPA